MKKLIILFSFCSFSLWASTATVNVPVKGTVTLATCAFSADSEIDFGSITALNVNNDTIPIKDLNMTLNCDWTASNVKLTFEPGAGIADSDKMMKSGLTGVGFKLTAMWTHTNLSFNTEYPWRTGSASASPERLAVKIKPTKIPSEDIAAGNIDTTLRKVRISRSFLPKLTR